MAESGKSSVKKILVFMATSKPELVDPARASLVQLRGALQQALREDTTGDYANNKKRVEVSVLVHGFQIEVGEELDSMEFTFEIRGNAQTSKASISWGWASRIPLTYIPGDGGVVAQWIQNKLMSDPMVDSTMLVFWGHGLGVGTTLTLPRHIPGDDEARETPLIDLLVFDSCLMAGAELAYEFRDLASYMIASQTLVETAPGGPPGLNLGALVSAFLQEDAWIDPVKAKAGVARERQRRLLEAAEDIVDLVGETKSGAQQLTLLDLERARGAAGTEIEEARRWLTRYRDTRAIVDVGQALNAHLEAGAVKLTGLLWLFTRLLGEAAAQAVERERVLTAVRGASFMRVRQFVDLRDLAHQVHQICRQPLLQLVALVLRNELTPRKGHFVVAHRAALPLTDRPRFSGVSVYCPWFQAENSAANNPVFNVKLEPGYYTSLALPDVTGWAKFAFGSLFEATAAERQPAPMPANAPVECLELLARLLGQFGCRCGEDGDATGGGPPVPGGGLADKPSRQSLLDKPAGQSLVDKPSKGSLGPSYGEA